MPKNKLKKNQIDVDNFSETKPTFKVKNSNFLHTLTQKQKYLIITMTTFLLVVLLGLGSNLSSNREFRNLLAGKKNSPQNQNNDTSTALARESLEILKQELGKNNPEDLITQKVSLQDLEIYPDGWVKRNFSENDRQNILVSGAAGDADNDGISNQLEYFYGSNPKNKFTLCAGLADKSDPKCQKTDKQNIDDRISPLTGLTIQQEQVFDIKRIDKQVAESMANSLVVASRQSLDFPEIYELSQTINLESEINSTKINSQPDTRDNLLEYAQQRLKVLEAFTDQDALSGFSEIYQVVDIEGLEALKAKYQTIFDNLNKMVVPQRFAKNHQATLLTIKKSIELIDLRLEGISKSTLEEKSFQEILKKKAIEMMAAYRILNEETAKN